MGLLGLLMLGGGRSLGSCGCRGGCGGGDGDDGAAGGEEKVEGIVKSAWWMRLGVYVS